MILPSVDPEGERRQADRSGGLASPPCGTALAQDFAEAPMPAERVAAGEPPPVAGRLPETSRVIPPVREVGAHGGTRRRGAARPGDDLTGTFTREPLFTWTLPGTASGPSVPNLAESIARSEDGSSVTVRLRAGSRWSGGAPFTAGDVAFHRNDVMPDD